MSRLLIPAQRREWIDDYLSVHKIVRISDLSEALGVSEATIRRDLEWLESEGVLERTYGGAILSRRIQLEPEYTYRAQTHTEEKCQVGLAVADLVEDGDIIFVNSGTTSTQVIRHIPVRADVTVITNNISAALEVGEAGFELTLLGGTFQPRSNSVAGHFAIENLSHVYASKAFVGVDGVSLKYGCTVPTSGEAQVVRRMLERTRGLITVMADHSKWGVVSNFEIATIDQVHRLVTDDDLGPDAHAALAVLGAVFQRALGTEFLYTAGAGYWLGLEEATFQGAFLWPNLIAIAIAASPLVVILISFGYILNSFQIVNNCMIGVTRIMVAMSLDRLLPEWFSKVDERWHTPANAHIAYFLGAIPVILVYNLWPAWGALTLGVTFACGYVFVFSSLAAALLPYRAKDIYDASPGAKYKLGNIPWVTILGGLGFVLGGIMVLMFMFFSPLGLTSSLAYVVVFGIIAVSAVWYYLAKRAQKARGIDVDYAFKEIPPE